MALSSLVSVFIPTRPLMMALNAMTTIHMSDMVKLEYSLSDYQTLRKSVLCVMGKCDVITLTPFLGAGLSLKIRKDYHLITKILVRVNVM
jgi:hypothetical protein